MQRSYQWLGLSTAPAQTKHGVVSFGQRFKPEREAGTRDVDLQQEPCGIQATEASVLLLVCKEERGERLGPACPSQACALLGRDFSVLF